MTAPALHAFHWQLTTHGWFFSTGDERQVTFLAFAPELAVSPHATAQMHHYLHLLAADICLERALAGHADDQCEMTFHSMPGTMYVHARFPQQQEAANALLTALAPKWLPPALGPWPWRRDT